MRVDSFSGAAANLRGANRTAENVLAVFKLCPRVSVWDMSEQPWLALTIKELERSMKIREMGEPYPWLRFKVIA